MWTSGELRQDGDLLWAASTGMTAASRIGGLQRAGSRRVVMRKQGASGFFQAVVIVAGSWLAPGSASGQAPPRPLVGLDHIPFAVKDLEAASETYRRIGFALKPGRFHENGIRNMHVKFPDGSGIELLTASRANDDMTTRYVKIIGQGEGPAYMSLHARDTEGLLRALSAGNIAVSREDGLLKLSDPALSFIFFVGDNRAKNDRPEHFAHANSAVAMTEVWLATDEVAAFRKLFTALGAAETREMVRLPQPVNATVFGLTNGKVVLLPKAFQRIEGRPIVGARFRVASGEELLLPPEAAHGMWLAFGGSQIVEDPPIRCERCAAWNVSREPFRVFGNTYYVGVADLSAILIAGRDGLILLDGALPQSAGQIAANITKLGFRTEDVELIVNSHAHPDHAGGIAALQRASGAIVATSAAGAAALRRGEPTEDDPQFGFRADGSNGFPKVPEVRGVSDGETLRVGELALTAHLTPGHTPGSTTWTWRSCEGERCLDIVYADSLSAVSAPGFKFGAAGRAQTFARSISTVEKLPCDVLLTPHSWDFDLNGKLKRRAGQPDVNPFVQPDACRAYAETARKNLNRRLDEEKTPSGTRPP